MSQAQARTLARKCALQAMYQWQLTGYDLVEIERQFVEEHGLGKAEVEYFKTLLHGIPARVDEIDASAAEFVDRPLKEIDPVERAILRVSGYELLFMPEIPYRVVLNEGVNLAKSFGASQGHRFINGILDKIAHKYRSVEIAAAKNGSLRP
ncbi:transcription antitermination factor NusB [Candidatus Methylospira mobilis]|uniref:Transcription antitermination protein NusB n=1 Tax=Candidatus Methylospira mobilis TaxID=1808979 RepID=A0A5Q0BHI7_9GAMM|nr:transcription antitermination factor NusB [Candidatus Methylospira mobilis]QFY43335.1 transcription antitermination factor NusB [Candidatus Methylospira mobilis]WNV03448.1 transcription antitermination factor NusB [Candidatus Methylospira mobilis]